MQARKPNSKAVNTNIGDVQVNSPFKTQHEPLDANFVFINRRFEDNELVYEYDSDFKKYLEEQTQNIDKIERDKLIKAAIDYRNLNKSIMDWNTTVSNIMSTLNIDSATTIGMLSDNYEVNPLLIKKLSDWEKEVFLAARNPKEAFVKFISLQPGERSNVNVSQLTIKESLRYAIEYKRYIESQSQKNRRISPIDTVYVSDIDKIYNTIDKLIAAIDSKNDEEVTNIKKHVLEMLNQLRADPNNEYNIMQSMRIMYHIHFIDVELYTFLRSGLISIPEIDHKEPYCDKVSLDEEDTNAASVCSFMTRSSFSGMQTNSLNSFPLSPRSFVSVNSKKPQSNPQISSTNAR